MTEPQPFTFKLLSLPQLKKRKVEKFLYIFPMNAGHIKYGIVPEECKSKLLRISNKMIGIFEESKFLSVHNM